MSIEELKQLLAELAASTDASWTDVDGEPMAERDVHYLDGRALRLQPPTQDGVQPDYFFEVRRVERLSPKGEWVGPFWRLEQFRLHDDEEYFSVVLTEWCQANMAAAGVRCADDDIPATSAAVAEIIRRMIFVD